MWQRAGRDWESIEKPKNHKTAKIQKVREISQRAGFAEESAPKSKDLKALKADFCQKQKYTAEAVQRKMPDMVGSQIFRWCITARASAVQVL